MIFGKDRVGNILDVRVKSINAFRRAIVVIIVKCA